MPSPEAARKSRRRHRRQKERQKERPKVRKCGCNKLRTHTGDPNAICLGCREKKAGHKIEHARRPTKTKAGVCDCCMQAKLFASNRRTCTRPNCSFQMCSDCHAEVMSMPGARAGCCPQCAIRLEV